MDYSAVKHLHMGCVALSISLFILRFTLQFQGEPWRRSLALRVGPHLTDTVLLGSALWLAFAAQQYPFVHAWLTAKLIILVIYILLAKKALAERTRNRVAWFIAALTSVAGIVVVAVGHSPGWGYF